MVSYYFIFYLKNNFRIWNLGWLGRHSSIETLYNFAISYFQGQNKYKIKHLYTVVSGLKSWLNITVRKPLPFSLEYPFFGQNRLKTHIKLWIAIIKIAQRVTYTKIRTLAVIVSDTVYDMNALFLSIFSSCILLSY